MADQGNEGLLSPYLRKKRLAAACPFLHGRVLDVGCGSGMLASIVAPENYLGIDIDQQSLKKARLNYPQHQFQSNLPSTRSDFNTIVALAVIEHLSKTTKFLSDLTELLANSSEARIIITTPHPSVDWLHTLGATLGLFSQHASEEHENLLDYNQLTSLAKQCGLHLFQYRRFLLGANQLAVFKRELQ